MRRNQDNLLKYMVLLPLIELCWIGAWMALWWLAPGLFIWLAPGPSALLIWLAAQAVVTALLLALANVPQVWLMHSAPESAPEVAPEAARRSFVPAVATLPLRSKTPEAS